MALARPLWPHQEKALAAFEEGRNRHAAATYLVVPPGGGKTLIGLEAVRRLGRPAVVLCPNTAIQAQWAAQWQTAFTPALHCSRRGGTRQALAFGLRGLTEPAPPLGSAPIR